MNEGSLQQITDAPDVQNITNPNLTGEIWV